MDFLINFLGLVASLAVLIWGADKFVDNSSLIAKKIGVSELTIGLTIVALGTSAPEIFVGISSVLNNSESIAMGAVVGSNISNIALIFGVSCIGISFLPKKTPIIQLMPFLVAALILGYVLIDLNVSKFDGILLLLSFCYFLYVINANRNTQTLIDEQQDKNNSMTLIFLVIGLINRNAITNSITKPTSTLNKRSLKDKFEPIIVLFLFLDIVLLLHYNLYLNKKASN